MGDNGNRETTGARGKAWYEVHPGRPSAEAVPVLTIVFWVVEDGSLFRSVGWLKEAFRDELQLKTMKQVVHRHVESIFSNMIRLGLVLDKDSVVSREHSSASKPI